MGIPFTFVANATDQFFLKVDSGIEIFDLSGRNNSSCIFNALLSDISYTDVTFNAFDLTCLSPTR